MHDLYAESAIRDAAVERWGTEVAPDGAIDRKAVAAKAFADPAERAWLEGLLWPRVGNAITRWHGEQERRQPPPRAIVAEVPLLFEAGMDPVFDATIAVIVSEDVRRKRADERAMRAAGEREARQLTPAEKAARADHVVHNNGSLEELEAALAEVLVKLQV